MVNNDCLWREATRFDASRPQASPKAQVAMTVGCLLLEEFIFPALVDRLIPKVWVKKNESMDASFFRDLKEDKISPQMLRNMTCYDKPAAMGDVFQEMVFKVLSLKALVNEGHVNFHVANFFLAVVFGFLHMWNMIFQEKTREEAMYQSINAVLFFWVTGYLYFHTNSIWPCIILHLAANRIGCVGEVYEYKNWLAKK